MNWNSDKIDTVSKNTIWEDHVKRESKFIKLPGSFNVTPDNLQVVTEKPNQREKRFLRPREEILMETLNKVTGVEKNKNENHDQESNESSNNNQNDPTLKKFHETLERSTKLPNEVHEMPETSSQEYGWYSRPLVQQSKRNAHKQCDLTKFADQMIRSTVHKPKEKSNK
eukprot:gb/GECH01013688.1/.p1 GENE.gb/GECH01013688.1/~~gb/GECH01013688.1/.p1  ORF type:complete len:169 (+),score=47.82 gb/GECH01013688.1/:1-507(+)